MIKLEIIKEQEVSGKEFKVYGTWDNPLFLAKDVAMWIENRNVSQMTKLVGEEDKGVYNVDTLGGTQKMLFLTEEGLFDILTRSRKAAARELKKEIRAILDEAFLFKTNEKNKDIDDFSEEYNDFQSEKFTTTELEVIKEQEVLGKEFKMYGDSENPLFLAKDVAEWIEHTNITHMMNTVDDDEKLTYTICNSGQKREMWFLTEDGLYEVLMQSRKPIAKAFKKQVKAILKELRQTGTYTNPNFSDEYSPQLQFLINTEREQRRQAKLLEVTQQEVRVIHNQLESTNQKVDSFKEVISLDTKSWRTSSQVLVRKIAQVSGGYDFIRDIQNDIYTILEKRAGVNLNTRLINKKKRLANEGASRSKQNAVSKLAIVGDDKKLIEIYLAVVKDMAIAKGIDSDLHNGDELQVEGFR